MARAGSTRADVADGTASVSDYVTLHDATTGEPYKDTLADINDALTTDNKIVTSTSTGVKVFGADDIAIPTADSRTINTGLSTILGSSVELRNADGTLASQASVVKQISGGNIILSKLTSVTSVQMNTAMTLDVVVVGT